MMKANDIETSRQMPAQPEVDPFLTDSSNEDSSDYIVDDKELYGRLQERKEWQTQTPTQDAKNVFQQVPTDKK